MAAPLETNESPIVIADDGEMQQVRQLLRDEDLSYTELVPSAEGEPARMDLLISNPRTALGVAGAKSSVAPDVHIVVASELSRTMRHQLQRSSCDFIVEGPVDPSALHLLIRHALYRGPERRAAARVPLGVPIKIKSGWRQRNATLLQLSMRGCGVAITGERTGNDLSVRLPAEYCEGERIDLPVCVLEDMGSSDGEHILALGFKKLSGEARAVLERAMRVAAGAVGQIKPGRVAQHAEAQPDEERPRETAAARPTSKADEDRRVAERVRYRRRLLGTTSGRAQVLLGQDLSIGGMRIGSDPDLSVGDEIKLALHGTGQRVLVRARVVRDDGHDGLGLCFVDPGEKTREGLRALVDSLRILGQPRREGDGRPGVVVGEVIEIEIETED